MGAQMAERDPAAGIEVCRTEVKGSAGWEGSVEQKREGVLTACSNRIGSVQHDE